MNVAEIVFLVLSPTLVFAAACFVPRGIRALRRRVDNRRARLNPQTTNPPIEEIAADLRRLLREHDRFARSQDFPMRARRLWALEAAITDCATQAARALEVPCPDRPPYGGFDKPRLRRLLRALAAEGLVLPATIRLLTPDNRF